MQVVFRMPVIIFTFLYMQTSAAIKWTPHVWASDNIEVTEEKVNLCQGFNNEEERICKTMMSNFVTLMLTPTGRQQIHLVVSSCNKTNEDLSLALTRENQLKLQLERSNMLLDGYKQREADTKLQILLGNQKEIELETRLDAALQELAQTKIQLGISTYSLNYSEFALKEYKQQITDLNNKFKLMTKAEARLEIKNEILIENNQKCQQINANLTSHVEHVVAVNSELRLQTQIMVNNANSTNSKLMETQKQYVETYTQLQVLKDRKAELVTKLELAETAFKAQVEKEAILQLNITELGSRVEDLDRNLLQCEYNQILKIQSLEAEYQEKLERQENESYIHQTTLQTKIENLESSLNEFQAPCQNVEQTTNKTEKIVTVYTESTPINSTSPVKSITSIESTTPIASTTKVSELPTGAVRLSTGIYLYHNEKYNWTEAREFCKARNMDLIAIESAEEYEAIFKYLKDFPGRERNHVYTSGCYSQTHGAYIWKSTGEPVNYTPGWASGHPSSILNYCIQIRMDDKFHWWAYADKEPFICEIL